MRAAAVLSVTLCLAAAAPHASPPAPQADGAKVYTGHDGLTVTIVWLSPRSERKVLVKVAGADGVFEGRVIPHDDESADGLLNLKTRWNGRDWHTVQQSKHAWSDGATTDVYLPSHRDGYSVSYDSAKSEKVEVAPILAAYVKARDAGEFAKLAVYDRQADVTRNQVDFDADLKRAQAACGVSFDAKIRWEGIDDELLRSYSVSSYCGNVLSALESICGDAAPKAVIAKQVKHISCRFGAALDLSVAGGNLSFTTAKDAANQDEWVKKTLMQKL